MSKSGVHIDGLEIRLKGVSPGAVRAAVDGLGDALLHHLSPEARGAHRRSVRIDAIDAGTHSVPQGASAADLQQALAEHIGREIQRRITQ